MRWGDLLNFDVFVIVVIALTTLYFIYITKRKKYPFSLTRSKKDRSRSNDSSDLDKITPPFPYSTKKKKKKKKNKHEERCRQVFQDIFKTQFKSIRPNWLKNPATGKNLELDGFCPDIKTKIGMGLAFEYDGIQHAQYNKHFHKKGAHEFIYQEKKDAWKSGVCKKNGILLIRIPHYVAFEDLDRFIRNKLRGEGLLVGTAYGKLYGNAFEQAFSPRPIGDKTGYDPMLKGMYS